MVRQQHMTRGEEADEGVVHQPMPEVLSVSELILGVPLEAPMDAPVHGNGSTDDAVAALRTTQVFHRKHIEQALAAAREPANLPVVDVPVPRAGEQTMIIRRPTRRRKPFDWHAVVGLASSAAVLVVMLGVADWSERHPVAPPAEHAASPAAPTITPAAPLPSAPIVVKTEHATTEDATPTATPSDRTGHTGRRVSKTRVRSTGHGATPSPRGGRVPPTRPQKDDDSSSAGTGSAIARPATRTRATSARGSAFASSAWVDPFASY